MQLPIVQTLAKSLSAWRLVSLCGLLACFQLGYADDRESAVTKLATMHIEPSVERLVQYAAQGDATAVELLIKAGVSVKEADPVRSVTALHNAAAQGHLKLVNRLIELGANVNAADWRGATPLSVATFYCRSGIIAVLLARGAQANVRPTAGPTPLVAAVYCGQRNVVESLVKAGASPELQDVFGSSPLKAAQLAQREDIAQVLSQSH